MAIARLRQPRTLGRRAGGPLSRRRIQELRIPGLTADANYQLNVEDAAALAQHDLVLFADAA